MASTRSTLLGQLPIHLGVDLVQPCLGDHAPADRGLVGHQHAREARTAKSLDCLGRAGQEPDLVPGRRGSARARSGCHPDREKLPVGVHPYRPRAATREDGVDIRPRTCQRFVRANIQIISPPDPAPHPPRKSREDLKSQVERAHRGDLAKGSRRRRRTGRHWPGLLAGCSGFSTKATIRPSAIELGDPAGPGIGSPEKDHGERIIMGAMERQAAAEGRCR